jgi:hypothetical protein
MRVAFPNPTGININMMPFKPGDLRTLPQECEEYIPLIKACGEHWDDEICFLTIDERQVEGGKTHRRGGVHTEAGKRAGWGGDPWGGDGVWMASNMEGTCRVWNTEIPKENLGEGGCCEHLDLGIVPSRLLDANELIRISDRVPHECVPSAKDGIRQFFRLVGPKVGAWFKEHSTSNPLCELPASIDIIEGNKFEKHID